MDQNQMNWGGYAYYGVPNPQAMMKFENALTAEEIDTLKKKVSQFSIAMTQEERLRGICNHRTEDGMHDALVQDQATGLMTCTICGSSFQPIDPDTNYEDIRDSVRKIQNILQTIKLLYIDLPKDAAREYFQIIPLLDKIPQLFEFAAKNFMKHDSSNWNFHNSNPTTYAMFQNLMGIFGAGNMMGAAQPMMGQPNMMGGFPPQQPMYQQPMMNQAMMNAPAGYPQAAYGQLGMPQSNGFGFAGASQVQPMMAPQVPGAGYQPQQGGFQYKPPVDTQAAQPTVPTTDIAAAGQQPMETVDITVKA